MYAKTPNTNEAFVMGSVVVVRIFTGESDERGNEVRDNRKRRG